MAVLVDDALGVFARADEVEEGLEESCGLEGDLAVVLVDVEQSALGPRARRDFGFVDRRRNSMEMENPGEGQAAETGADDRDGGRHGCAPVVACQQRMGADRSDGLMIRRWVWETLAWPCETLGQDACDGLGRGCHFRDGVKVQQSTARNNRGAVSRFFS